MADNRNTKIQELNNEISTSKAYLYQHRIEAFSISQVIFRRNFVDLQRIFAEMKRPELILKLMGYENREFLDFFQIETTRLIQNYLESSATLINLTRNRMEGWYSTIGVYKEYCLIVEKEFKVDLLHNFMKDLRNFTFHYNLPGIYSNARWNRSNSFSHRFFIHRTTLDTWDRWSILGKKFMDNQGEHIFIEDCSTDYYYKMNNFQDWIINRIKIEHKAELEWLRAKQSEYKALLEEDMK